MAAGVIDPAATGSTPTPDLRPLELPLAVTKNAKPVDYAKSTGAYPTPENPTTARMADEDVDYSGSTGAYPMQEGEGPQVVSQILDADGKPIDFTASTGAYPTIGPVSTGEQPAVIEQRAGLGLTDDPSGESDVGAPARPSTVAVPRDTEGKLAQAVADKVVQPPAPQPARGTRRS